MSKVEETPKFLNSKKIFKLMRYPNIDEEVMAIAGMSTREWRICANIGYWCNHEKTSTVAISRAELGELFGLSDVSMKKIVRDLVSRKFLKLSKNYHLAVTSKWIKMIDTNGFKVPKSFVKTPETPEKPKDPPKEESKKEPQNEVAEFPYFEEEFGEDKASMVDRPSLNQVKKKVLNLRKTKKISTELSLEIGGCFWRKQESVKWNRVSNFHASLKRYIDAWKLNIEKYPEKFPERELKIVTPTNIEEMRLFLKQMSDEDRDELVFGKGDGVIVINSINGIPIMKESRESLNGAKYENFMKFLLGNFKDGKLQLKRSKR
jgi:hypothetical protein